jgi:hypothetical protein
MALKLAYDCAREIIGSAQLECFSVVQTVEQLRSQWRPERVRVVLLAESHVWTSCDETQSHVKQPDDRQTGFARFVYCLGYGEPQLVVPEVRPNKGTSQYWRLFHDTVRGPMNCCMRLMKTGEIDSQRRVQNKFDLLNEMQRAGIWLVDASVTALYQSATQSPVTGNKYNVKKLAAGNKYTDVLKCCWNSHIREVLLKCAPSGILIVGKGVKSAIGDDLCRALGTSVEVETINQPNARMSREAIDRDRRVCFEFCRKHTGLRGPMETAPET